MKIENCKLKIVLPFTKELKSAKFKIRPIIVKMKTQNSKLKTQKCYSKFKSIKTFTFLFVILTFTFCLFTLFLPKVSAQIGSVGIASYQEISGSKVEDGDIIVVTSRGYELSNEPYDPKLAGVVTTNPAITLKTDTSKKGYPVIKSGTAQVKVTGTNGTIKKGDFITSSDIPGTGMKATKSGMVLGEALESADFKKSNDIKLITVAVNPHAIQIGQSANSIFDLFKLSKEVTNQQPSKALQYLVAGIITIVTFGCGFLIFARTVNTGLEALGRNPLAGRMIQFSIIFNIIMIIVIVVVGTGLAYIVIRL